jgi:hypothetical protein
MLRHCYIKIITLISFKLGLMKFYHFHVISPLLFLFSEYTREMHANMLHDVFDLKIF